jgi:hypothetical protein
MVLTSVVVALQVALMVAVPVAGVVVTDPICNSKQFSDILDDMEMVFVEEGGKFFVRTKEFFPRQYEISEVVGEIIDRMYCKGHYDGFQRGAYEMQTREDV